MHTKNMKHLIELIRKRRDERFLRRLERVLNENVLDCLVRTSRGITDIVPESLNEEHKIPEPSPISAKDHNGWFGMKIKPEVEQLLNKEANRR